MQGRNHGAGEGVLGFNTSNTGHGVHGVGKNGVFGESSIDGQNGVWGKHAGKGTGVFGESSAADLGAVEGHNSGTGGIGVRGRGATGVKGVSNTASRGAVEGSMENASGYGVWGNSWGIGVRGQGGNNGVHGIGTNGYGGLFQGGKAQLRLVPKGTTGPPSGAHTKGEIYMDKAGTLFICIASSTSTAAAKWTKVTTTAV